MTDRDNFDPAVLTEIVGRPRSRAELEAEYGRVWTPDELNAEFVTTAIIPPVLVVRRKLDNVVGNMLMQADPPFFVRFVPSPEQA